MADFQRDQLLRGDEVRRLADSHHEIGGFFKGLKNAGIDAVPLFAARAIPSGPIASEALQELIRQRYLISILVCSKGVRQG